MPALTRAERVSRALWREPVDHLPVQTNFTGRMGRKLAMKLGVPLEQLSARLGNHLIRLDSTIPEHVSADGQIRFDAWGAGWDTQTEGYWHVSAPMSSPVNLDEFAWPDANDPGLLNEAQRLIERDGGQHFAVPNFGMCLFERAWSLRGFDALLMDLLDRPTWVEDLLEHICEVQLQFVKRFLTLPIHGGYFGDDYGAQRGMLFSPRLWRQLIKPRLARLFAPFREAGMPVILHSDGDIWDVLPDLVDIGLTCLNPVQPEVMHHEHLQREFGAHLSFYGGISTQTVLPTGTVEEIRTATRACQQTLAPQGTGLLLGPSHRLQSDIPVENIVAMLEAFPE